MSSPEPEPQVAAKLPRRKRGHNRVASLLNAAAEVFARVGYEAATMTEIAASAGASIGSLYQFFPTKPLLADALYLREMDLLSEALERAGEEALDKSGRIEVVGDELLAALLVFIDAHPALLVVADRRGAEVSRKANRPTMREQLVGILRRARPGPTPQVAWRVAGLVLLMMKGAAAVRLNEDPDAEILIADARRMLRQRLTDGFAE